MSATLSDTAGHPVAGRRIDFSIGAVPLCSATTNAAGTASCRGSVTQTLQTVLKRGYTARFNASGPYAGSTATGNLLTAGSLRV